MLLDATQKRWIVIASILTVAGVGLYLIYVAVWPGEARGGSSIGLWYGTIGSLMMIYAGGLSFLRRIPSWWWVGKRQTHLRGHIWFGLASFFFVLCHSGFSWGGPLEIILWIVTGAVLITGIYGLLLQQILPRLLTTRVVAEAPYEQIPRLCQVMRRKADDLVDSVCGEYDARQQDILNTRQAVKFQEDGKLQLRAFFEQDIRPFLASELPARSPLLNPLQTEARFTKLRRLSGLEDRSKELDDLARLCEERRQLNDQERIHFWLHSWLLLHIPLSVALLVLGIAHAVTALYY